MLKLHDELHVAYGDGFEYLQVNKQFNGPCARFRGEIWEDLELEWIGIREYNCLMSVCRLQEL